MKESQIQRSILDYLAAEGILAFRMNSGAVRSNYKGKDRFMRFGVPGMADILAFELTNKAYTVCKCWHSTPVWIEVKTERGKQSELQKSFQEKVESYGHIYRIARSVDDVKSIL